MIVGVGVDLMRRERIERIPLDSAFIRRTFTPGEREQAEQRPDARAYYATRFAGKEAVFKALRGDPDVHRLEDIEILSDAVGAPHVALFGQMAARAKELGASEVLVSLTYETQVAMAFAVAQSGDADFRCIPSS